MSAARAPRPRHADRAREALRHATARKRAGGESGHDEGRRARGDPQVAGEREREPPAAGLAVQRGDHGLLELADGARGFLENADHQVNLVPILILNLGGEQQEICAGGKMLALVANDEAGKIPANFLQ